MDLIQELQERGLIQDIMPGTQEQLNNETTSGYIGFDPTADSLHIGSLLPITLLMRLQKAGHTPYALIGGATGMIGDPSGKSDERNLLDIETITYNSKCIKEQLEKILNKNVVDKKDVNFKKKNRSKLVVVNNYNWFRNAKFLEFIRDVGKHITVNYMMSKDSVKKRLETGLSFTEFTYQLIQGYDFYYLYTKKNVQLQMGGADQWGNIVTGTELIRRKCTHEAKAFAFTCKLITKSDGGKFGKTEGGNVWLSRHKTSPYQFYQFWLNLSDADAERMAMTFSFKSVNELKDLIAEHKNVPHERKLQKAIAEELTILVHNQQDYEMAKMASEVLFSKGMSNALHVLDENVLLEVMETVPKVESKIQYLEENGLDLISFLSDSLILSSKGEARKMLQNGGISINKQKITSIDYRLTPNHLLFNKYLLIQKGKNYTLAIFN